MVFNGANMNGLFLQVFFKTLSALRRVIMKEYTELYILGAFYIYNADPSSLFQL